MAWQTPKTDWKARYDGAGLFIGDFFNVTDYNRIKNNLVYLRNLATQVADNVPSITVGADKHLPNNTNPDFDNDNFFADEINMVENGLYKLDQALDFFSFGKKKTYYDNGRFIDYTELNRIEKAELKLYNILTSTIAGRRRLSFKLGSKAPV
jgi:hypothetical protein